VGFINNQCYPADTGSLEYNWPYITVFTDTNCKTLSAKVNAEALTCTISTDDDDVVDKGSYDKYNFFAGNSTSQASSKYTLGNVGIVASAIIWVVVQLW
jgi:hypothetical protein